MKNMKAILGPLIFPFLIVALFLLGLIYEDEILLQFGVTTVEQLKAILPKALGVGVWLSLAYLFNRVLVVLLWEPLNRRMPIPRLLRDVTTVLIYVLAITGIVGAVFGKAIGPFWAASGAGAIVIGLALRNVILDIFIGLAMNFDRPFELGDFIQVVTGPAGGPAGRVVELNWRTTRLVTGEGNLMVIPNGKLGDMIVTNFSKPAALSEFEISVFLDFAVPPARALRVLNAAVRSVAGGTGVQEDPAPKARVRGIAPQGVEYKIKYFLDPRQAGPGKARHAVWLAVLEQLHQAGLQPATPKQDVYHAPLPTRQLDTRELRDRTALLARIELFQGLADNEREELAAQMEERLFREGTTVIKRGEAGESMFILCEGLLNVMIALKPDQPEAVVARLQAGMFFGEMSALTGEVRSATVVAATDSLAFEITKDQLGALLLRRPELAETISRAVAARKLRNSEAMAKASSVVREAEQESITAQLVGRMMAFFGIKKRTVPGARELEKNSTMSPFA